MKPVSFSVSLSQDERALLEVLKKKRGLKSAAEAVRELICGPADFFGLAPNQAERLRKEAAHRKLDPVSFIKESLALRYEQLAAEDRERAAEPLRSSAEPLRASAGR